jgi:glycosyltransferase involved in cell wall biosynthesis
VLLFSVVICTHNPRVDYLLRVLDALKAQTLPKAEWELLLIDNSSKEPLAQTWDLSWHPQGRHIREEALGLTHARLCGMANSKGQYLVFVDDDNVLDPDYLEKCSEIARKHPNLGSWGGSLRGEFEVEPPASFRPYLIGYAVSEITQDYWGNQRDPQRPVYGAGMCVRREVVDVYRSSVAHDPLRLSLDRSGDNLTAGGDLDLAWTGLDLGFGLGYFHELRITHLISKSRLTESYLVKLFAGFSGCNLILNAIHPAQRLVPPPTFGRRLRSLKSYLLGGTLNRRIWWESRKTVRSARKLLASNRATDVGKNGVD